MQAALLRFRPIMMTTLAALFGALPLALEGGTGSELRNPLGITIVGGLLLSASCSRSTPRRSSISTWSGCARGSPNSRVARPHPGRRSDGCPDLRSFPRKR